MAHPVSTVDHPLDLFRFGAFEVDTRRGEIRKNGLKMRLQEQPFRLLLALLERPGEIVSREELRQQLWSGDTVVEFDLAVNTAVHKLREALLDSAASPRYVETVPKRGYRFIAPVERVGGTVAPQEGGVQAPRRKWAFTAMGVAAAIVLGALGFSMMPRREVPAPLISALTTYAGFEWGPAFSPDGSQVAFTWEGERGGNLDIYLKVIGPDPPLRLTTDSMPELAASWSPDGRQIAYLRCLPDGKTALMLMSPLGGGGRVLAEGLFSKDRASWTPDGKWLLASTGSEPPGRFEIRAYSAADGTSHSVTAPASKEADFAPSVSADGKWVAFSRGADFRRALMRVALLHDAHTAGEPLRLTPAEFDVQWPMGPAWLEEGRQLLFHTKGSGGPQLWRIDAAGGEPQPLAIGGATTAWQPDFSPRTGRLVFAQGLEQVNLFAVRLAREPAGAAEVVRSAYSTKRSYNPHFSPDGKRIVFTSDRSGNTEIWVSDRDGGQPRMLTAFGGPQTGTPKISPDGRWVVFDSRAGGKAQLYLVRPDGGGLQRFSMDDAESKVPEWSHDGKWVYFVSGRSGSNQIWKLPLDVAPGDSRKGKAIQVTKEGGYVPQASPDGQWIYFAKDDSEISTLWRIRTEGGEERQVAPAVTHRTFFVARNGIYFVQRTSEATTVPSGGKWTLSRYDLERGVAHPVADLPFPLTRGMGVSPDGRELLVALLDHEFGDLVLVEHFR